MSKKHFKKTHFWLLLSAIGVLIVCLLFFRSSPQVTQKSVATETVMQFHSQLDGIAVSTTEQTMPRVVGAMIDNHPDSRPQAGIALARVVYEAPVEGGFTRYFALFSADQEVDKIGPVRSARPYFLDWLEEYGVVSPVYMHSGGSPDALVEIDKRGLFDTNEFYWGQYYWRGSEAVAPYNLFTRSKLWQAIIEKFGDRHPTSTWQGWLFGSVGGAATTTVKAISIDYNGDYSVGWQYQVVSQRYGRIVNGRASSDREGRRIVADNIIVLEMPVKILDDYGRKAIRTIGSGSARVVRQGVLIRGTWKKTAAGDRTRIYDMDGVEIALVPGITWVEVVPTDTAVGITQ